LMNLRQHTVYLGVIQLVFGCLAVAVAFRRRRPGEYGAFADASNAVSTEFKNALTMPVAAVVKHRADVIFFGVFFVVAVLLALGRNFPLYRLFYSVMPFAENLRAPVKFLHLAEISLCALLAFGLDYFCVALSVRRLSATGKDAAGSKSQKRGTRGVEDVLAYGDNRLWKVFAIACAGIGICVLFGLGVASARERELVALWTELGLGNASDVLMRCMTGALVRASILFLLCGGIFWMARIKGASLYVAHGIPLCLALFLTADLMTAAKRYVTVWDEYERLAPREIMARLMQDGGHFRVSMPVRSGIYPVWQQYVFPKRHIVVVDSVAQSTDPMERQVVEALARDPFRFWQITSTRDVLAPVAALDSLLKHPSARIMGYFNVMQDGQVALADAARGQQAWIRVANVLPWAAVYPGLEVADDVSLSERLADPKWDPTRVTLVSESRDVPGGWDGMVPAEVVKYSPNRIELRARTTNAGVLVINDKYDPDWEAFVNGNAAPILRCNGMMRGVAVPSGESQIAFVYRPCWKAFLVQAAAMGIVVCWLLCHVGIVVAARRRQSRDADPHRRAPTRIMLCQSKRMWVTDLRARLHSFRQRVGPLWWYAILTFCAGRLGDLCNIYVGVFYLPAALSPEDLGTVDPVTRLVGFAAIPVAVISMVGAKYLSAYHARNENGKIKQFMRDMALLGFVSAILFVAALLATFESFRVRLGLDSRFLLPTLCALGVLSCWQPLVQVVLQGMQKFNTIAFLGVGGNALRVVLVLCLVPLLHLSGLLLATFVSGLTIVGLSLWSLKGFMSREISPVAYYAEWRDILLFARGIAVMAIVGNLQGFIEPFVVKHSLPVQDAAGYYMVCRFGYIPSWLVGAISFVLFPLLSHRHERGEDTRGYLRQALLVTLTVSVGGTLLLGVISKWLFGLMPQWQPFLPYAPLVWMIGLQVTLDSIISIYTTHEIACRRFRFLWMTVPMALLDIVVLYGSFGWGAFRDWLPESIWRTMDQSIPRTLTYAIVVMCATRLLAALALALNWWREEKTLGAPGSGSSTIIGSSETGVGSRVS
jgi:O-antigen/teichoic acid export membrane protein